MTKISSYVHNKPDLSETIPVIYLDKSKDLKPMMWQNIRECVKKAKSEGRSRIILCTKIELFENRKSHILSKDILDDAKQLNAKILIINADYADLMVPVSNDLIWVDFCSDIGLAIIFESCFPMILLENKIEEKTIDEKLCQLTSNKFIVYPLQKGITNRIDKTEKLNNRIERLIKQSDILLT